MSIPLPMPMPMPITRPRPRPRPPVSLASPPHPKDMKKQETALNGAISKGAALSGHLASMRES
eukprot:14564266-Alexandrium_andersonii.AAC.1